MTETCVHSLLCSTQTGTERYTLLIRNVVRTNLLDFSKPRSLNVSGRDKLAQLVKGFGNEVSVATTVNDTFFDVLVPDLNVGVVFDSVSEDFYSTPVDTLQQVSRSAQKSGLTCIHVFDWDDWDKIVALAAPRTTRIGARKCGIVKVVDQKVANKFIRENHVQGQARGAVLTLGLEHDNELVMCMSFGRSRYNRKYTYELLRLCSKRGVEVVGGASKLFKFATNQMELDSIVSYCDLAKFSGDVYEKMGMTLVNRSAPNVVWSRENKHVTSNLLRQRGYDQLFNTNYGKGTDNEILMLLNGWVPVCDCGQGVYEYVC